MFSKVVGMNLVRSIWGALSELNTVINNLYEGLCRYSNLVEMIETIRRCLTS